METSDSEYFESADEDFGSEDEFNKNKTAERNSTSKSKITNKIHTLSDINENKKENTDLTNVDNKKHTQDSVTKNRPVIDNCEIKTPDRILADDKTANKKDDKHQLDNNSSKKILEEEDNLWNEGDGWGVSDESDIDVESKPQKVSEQKNASANQNEQKPYSTSTSADNDKKVEIPSEGASAENSNMWDDEDWEKWDTVKEEKLPDNSIKPDGDNSGSNQIWKGWGNWGVTSILSTATQGVSSLTNSVSQGLSSVLETGIGAPDPEKLAALNKQFERKLSTETSSPPEECENRNVIAFGLSNIGNLVSGVSKLVETTGTKVISGGLDTLETIGKKTMEVIQDGDPGLKKKRAFLNLEGDKPVLSQVLREAKEKAEEENKALQEKHFARKVNYESIFDDHQGLVHLEALEMLSKQCDMKLQLLIESSSGSALTDIQETLDQVKELCELPDEEEDEQISTEELKDRLKSAVEEIGVNITYDKLITMWEETECWLGNLNLNICNENEIHQQAVETLAQLTAIAVEQFHKAGELLLVKDHHSTADEADSLVQLTTTLTSVIGVVAAKFSDKMNTKTSESANKETINSLITNIFFEAANSSSYIQDAFQLLVPVLQMGAV